MPVYHRVTQGEFLAQIAAKYGFRNPATIWDDPRNAQLKKKRKSPHVLMPGDILVIPDKSEKRQEAAVTRVHQFVLDEPKVKLRIALKDWDGEPLKSMECVLKVGSQIYNLTTNAEGVIEEEIPVTATEGTLTIKEMGEEIKLQIGHLDPSSEETGWKARLRNLGYLAEPGEPDAQTLRWALEEFQCNNGLKVDGTCNDQTRAKLENTHGS